MNDSMECWGSYTCDACKSEYDDYPVIFTYDAKFVEKIGHIVGLKENEKIGMCLKCATHTLEQLKK